MKYSLRSSGLLFVALTLAATSLRSETAGYPEKNPAFSVEVPEGWSTKREHGSLMLGAPDADAAVLFQHITDVQEDVEAKAGLKPLAEQAAKTFGMTDAKLETPAASIQVGAFKGFATEYKGKDKDGEAAFWQCFIFTPEKGHYYLMTVMCSDKDDKKTADNRNAIVHSIKPPASEDE
jgi:hypothetical protein